MTPDFNPFIEFLIGHVMVWIKFIPICDFVEFSFPSFVRWFQGWAETHNIKNRKLFWHVQQGFKFSLDTILPNGRDPPDRVAQSGGGQIRQRRQATGMTSPTAGCNRTNGA